MCTWAGRLVRRGGGADFGTPGRRLVALIASEDDAVGLA